MAKNNSSLDRAKIGANVVVQIATMLFLFVMVNYLAFNHYKRWDFSRDKKYTLSDQTRRVLSKLKKPVSFIAFFSGASPITGDVNSLLKEYDYSGKGKVHVETIDPYLNMTSARELESKYKLNENENVVIVDYDGHTKFVSANDMAEFEPALSPMDQPHLKAFKGEQALTSALLEVTEKGLNKLYVLAGHGEPTLEDQNISGLKTFIERQNIKLEPLKLTDVNVIPPDCQGVLLIGPKYDFSDRDLKILNAYWTRKGRLFVLLDPVARTPKLTAFINEQGVTVNDDRILKTVALNANLTGVLKEITGDFIPGSPITKRLGNVNAMFLGVTQSLTLDKQRAASNNTILHPLIRASKGYWGETKYDVGNGGGVYFDPKEDHADPVAAASIERGGINDTRVQVDSSSRMVLVGNSAFVRNDAMTEADLDFFLSSMNWLMDREELIGIAPKAVHEMSLSLSEAQLGNLALLTMIVIPGSAAALGILSWLKRRR